ncbi:MAG TPA: serine/threonine-protein kinase [Planctomycetota bacterium]|nr:serine/threonine-protein kinase [Planctomycetota bacterium]
MRALGPYDLEDVLGRGAMGTVHRARHRATGAVRALKVLDGPASGEAIERFRREAEALARVAGKGVVTVHETGLVDGRAWYAMDLLPGGSLRDRLAERGRYPWREAALLVAPLARTLERCHAAGIVHRDMKPENVLFDEQGNARIADFGLARDLRAATLTATGTAVGTPGYMAPEQVDGKDARATSDVFSLGALLFELATGERPYGGRTIAEHVMRALKQERKRPSDLAPVPEALDRLVDRALAPDPARRIASAGALADELEALGEAPSAPKRRPVALIASGVAAVLVVVGAVALVPRPDASVALPPPPRSDHGKPREDALAKARAALVERDTAKALAALEPGSAAARKLSHALAAVSSLASTIEDYLADRGPEPRGAIEAVHLELVALDRELGASAPVARRGVCGGLDGLVVPLLYRRLGLTELTGKHAVVAQDIVDGLGEASPPDPIFVAARIESRLEDFSGIEMEMSAREDVARAAQEAYANSPLAGMALMAVATDNLNTNHMKDLSSWLERTVEAEEHGRPIVRGFGDSDRLETTLARHSLRYLCESHEKIAVALAFQEKDPARKASIWRRSREITRKSDGLVTPDHARLARLALALGELEEAERQIGEAAELERPLLELDLARRKHQKGTLERAETLSSTAGDEFQRQGALAEKALILIDLGRKDEARAILGTIRQPVYLLIHDLDEDALTEQAAPR